MCISNDECLELLAFQMIDAQKLVAFQMMNKSYRHFKLGMPILKAVAFQVMNVPRL
jgi:hypothetical protein